MPDNAAENCPATPAWGWAGVCRPTPGGRPYRGTRNAAPLYLVPPAPRPANRGNRCPLALRHREPATGSPRPVRQGTFQERMGSCASLLVTVPLVSPDHFLWTSFFGPAP